MIWFFKNYKRNLGRLAANDFSVTAGRAVLSKQGRALIENLHHEGDSLKGKAEYNISIIFICDTHSNFTMIRKNERSIKPSDVGSNPTLLLWDAYSKIFNK